MRRWYLRMRRLALSAMVLIGSLLLVEVVFRIAAIDHRAALRTVFYQGADLPVHQCSADPFLRYELKPNTDYQGRGRNEAPYFVHIDPSGARVPAHPAAKQPGTFRILAFGGSTLYGALVNDDQTIPAALEHQLNTGGTHFEVWNFGTSAYSLAQAAHLGRIKLRSLAPDLILVQLHNVGPRPYPRPPLCSEEELLQQFDQWSPEFYLENYPTPEFIPPDVHRSLLAHSALYRTSVVASRPLWGPACPYCDSLGSNEAAALFREAEGRHTPVVFFAIPADRSRVRPDDVFRGLPSDHFIDLNRPDADPDFYEVHPRAPVLDRFARLLGEIMKERGFLTARTGEK